MGSNKHMEEFHRLKSLRDKVKNSDKWKLKAIPHLQYDKDRMVIDEGSVNKIESEIEEELEVWLSQYVGRSSAGEVIRQRFIENLEARMKREAELAKEEAEEVLKEAQEAKNTEAE